MLSNFLRSRSVLKNIEKHSGMLAIFVSRVSSTGKSFGVSRPNGLIGGVFLNGFPSYSLSGGVFLNRSPAYSLCDGAILNASPAYDLGKGGVLRESPADGFVEAAFLNESRAYGLSGCAALTRPPACSLGNGGVLSGSIAFRFGDVGCLSGSPDDGLSCGAFLKGSRPIGFGIQTPVTANSVFEGLDCDTGDAEVVACDCRAQRILDPDGPLIVEVSHGSVARSNFQERMSDKGFFGGKLDFQVPNGLPAVLGGEHVSVGGARGSRLSRDQFSGSLDAVGPESSYGQVVPGRSIPRASSRARASQVSTWESRTRAAIVDEAQWRIADERNAKYAADTLALYESRAEHRAEVCEARRLRRAAAVQARIHSDEALYAFRCQCGSAEFAELQRLVRCDGRKVLKLALHDYFSDGVDLVSRPSKGKGVRRRSLDDEFFYRRALFGYDPRAGQRPQRRQMRPCPSVTPLLPIPVFMSTAAAAFASRRRSAKGCGSQRLVTFTSGLGCARCAPNP